MRVRRLGDLRVRPFGITQQNGPGLLRLSGKGRVSRTGPPQCPLSNFQMGLNICNAYATTLNNMQVAMWMANLGYSAREGAMWTVSSVNYLRPQYNYLLGT